MSEGKKYIRLPPPAIVECYNKHMSGADLADLILDLYKINHRSKKKCYMRIVLNSALAGCCMAVI